MYNDDYMYAVERDPEYLAHFGVKGMKWGVRKAREAGNSRKLGRMYRKAARKLARLEKRANNGKKYARRAALLGAGAAAAGGLAAAGTGGVGRLVARAGDRAATASKGIGNALQSASHQRLIPMSNRTRFKIRQAGNAMVRAGSVQGANSIRTAGGTARRAIEQWGKGNSIGASLERGTRDIYNNAVSAAMKSQTGQHILGKTSNAVKNATGSNISGNISKIKGVSNNTYARIAAGAVGAGLAAGAGYNAYRAATTKRAARKAAQWRSEMNKAFKGTQYANGGGNRQGKTVYTVDLRSKKRRARAGVSGPRITSSRG